MTFNNRMDCASHRIRGRSLAVTQLPSPLLNAASATISASVQFRPWLLQRTVGQPPADLVQRHVGDGHLVPKGPSALEAHEPLRDSPAGEKKVREGRQRVLFCHYARMGGFKGVFSLSSALCAKKSARAEAFSCEFSVHTSRLASCLGRVSSANTLRAASLAASSWQQRGGCGCAAIRRSHNQPIRSLL